ERLTVAQEVAGSKPVAHPNQPKRRTAADLIAAVFLCVWPVSFGRVPAHARLTVTSAQSRSIVRKAFLSAPIAAILAVLHALNKSPSWGGGHVAMRRGFRGT